MNENLDPAAVFGGVSMACALQGGATPSGGWVRTEEIDRESNIMAIIKNEKPQNVAVETHNAVCVDVIDRGMIDTPWGRKPRIEFVFETGDDAHGNRHIVSRTFNYYTHPKGALAGAIRFWLGHDIADDGNDFALESAKGEQAEIVTEKVESGTSGRIYRKILNINRPGSTTVQPSGNYVRQ